jgi:hypothetical protein
MPFNSNFCDALAMALVPIPRVYFERFNELERDGFVKALLQALHDAVDGGSFQGVTDGSFAIRLVE